MAYNEKLAKRIREILKENYNFIEKKMFGGVCFLLNGNMACGLLNDDIIVRVGPQNYEASLKRPYTRRFDITGRPMKGRVMVSADGIKTKKQLKGWLERGVGFALTRPAK